MSQHISLNQELLKQTNLEALFDAAVVAPVGLALWSGDVTKVKNCALTLEFVNLLGALPSGKLPVDLVNREMSVALPELIGSSLETAIREVLQNNTKTEVLVRAQQPDGAIRNFRNVVSPVGDGLVMTTFFEVTREALLEREFKVERRTKLASRAYFDDVFLELLEEQSKSENYAGLIFIDIDKFKSINDTYGHMCGDEILSDVARRLRLVKPAPKLIARWGGDEFAILTDGSPEDNESLAQEILEAFEKPLKWAGADVKVNLSLGLVTAKVTKRLSPRSFLVAADRAMYQAKRAGGRNLATSEIELFDK